MDIHRRRRKILRVGKDPGRKTPSYLLGKDPGRKTPSYLLGKDPKSNFESNADRSLSLSLSLSRRHRQRQTSTECRDLVNST